MARETIFSIDPITGRRHKTKNADYTIAGDLEVNGALTRQGEPVSGGLGGAVTEDVLDFSDVTTADVSDTQHGLCPKLSGNASEFLNGEGEYVEPAGGGGGLTYEAADPPTTDGLNDTFTFSAPPKIIFRNGVMEFGSGTVVGNDFVYDSIPMAGGVIDGYV